MAKRVKRAAFPGGDRPRMPEAKETYHADQPLGGVFGFFRDFGTRETIESIIIAVVLALMFRAFEAEAFIIPTGSMAPSLQGQHKDLECENCGFRYRAGASQEATTNQRPDKIISTYCPICQYETTVKSTKADHVTNNGDRILVNKFIYDFVEPKRYDVLVFKNPNNGKQNYIKRLIGLPGDNILIENGDIYLMTPDGESGWERRISRKPAHKLRHIMQVVDDTDHIGDDLESVKWPDRWQEFEGGNKWERIESNGHPAYLSSVTSNPSWLRYRHFRPLKSDWPKISSGFLPDRFLDKKRKPLRPEDLPAGRLIGDHYAYNDGLYDDRSSMSMLQDLGLHWVGDIGLECWAEVKSDEGVLLLDLVEGGSHFTCRIDVATGEAVLECRDPSVKFLSADGTVVQSPVASTNLTKPGKYHIEYVNADDRIHLWINNKLAKFDAADYEREGYVIPKYSKQDPGDAEPAGIAAENLDVRLTRLKVIRDVYYTSVWGTPKHDFNRVSNLENETEFPADEIQSIFRDPDSWSSPAALQLFKRKKQQQKPMFELKKSEDRDQDQFLPMGDNSPQSLDGRVWDGPKYVERDMLIGRALFIYWPHTLNEPVKYFPNFGRMGFIR